MMDIWLEKWCPIINGSLFLIIIPQSSCETIYENDPHLDLSLITIHSPEIKVEFHDSVCYLSIEVFFLTYCCNAAATVFM